MGACVAVACDGAGGVVVVVAGGGVGRYAEVEAEAGGGGGGWWCWKGGGGGGGVESESDVPFNSYTVLVLPINAVLSPSNSAHRASAARPSNLGQESRWTHASCPHLSTPLSPYSCS